MTILFINAGMAIIGMISINKINGLFYGFLCCKTQLNLCPRDQSTEKINAPFTIQYQKRGQKRSLPIVMLLFN
jgi:hypothetical protein